MRLAAAFRLTPSAYGRRFAGVRADAPLALVCVAFGTIDVVHHQRSPAEWLVMLGLPASVLLARRGVPRALAAAVVIIALEGVLFGRSVRCGVTIPVLGYLIFAGARAAGSRAQLASIVGLAAAGLLGQALTDPVVADPAGGVIAATLYSAAVLLGRLVRGHDDLVRELRSRSTQLEHERDRTARLAAAEERGRLAEHVAGAAQAPVATILAEVQAARRADAPANAADFEAIEGAARSALEEMRGVLGILRDDDTRGSRRPLPTLAELDAALAARGGACRVRREGAPTSLSPALEVAAYRIAQQLAELVDPKHVGVDLSLRFAGDRVELRLEADGAGAEDRGGLAAIRERARLHGGAVELVRGARTRAHAWLPVTAHA